MHLDVRKLDRRPTDCGQTGRTCTLTWRTGSNKASRDHRGKNAQGEQGRGRGKAPQICGGELERPHGTGGRAPMTKGVAELGDPDQWQKYLASRGARETGRQDGHGGTKTSCASDGAASPVKQQGQWVGPKAKAQRPVGAREQERGAAMSARYWGREEGKEERRAREGRSGLLCRGEREAMTGQRTGALGREWQN
ncbi:uncharacterized protein N7459_008457 [Penicillium hispanicum]|uniref:uncharacterized protein n=1 Tax=Penicillium hispanicum TaxID=1080232 RepID=UPI002541788C|nr:uncharacterized protein N7459_008457 [Penicillium hispanicum]KAJ5574030.1 hypothetical protein N7459_008457 [Penicillium hispanicum]